MLFRFYLGVVLFFSVSICLWSAWFMWHWWRCGWQKKPWKERKRGRGEEVNNLSSSGSNQGRIKRRSASFLFLFVYEGSFALVCVCKCVRMCLWAGSSDCECGPANKKLQKIVEFYLQCNKNEGINGLCVRNEFH